MARVTEVTVDNASDRQREVLEAELDQGGEVYNTSRLWAYRPGSLRALKVFAAALEEERALPAGLVHLVRMRVAQINGCPF